MAGVETTGFNRKLLSQLLAEIEAAEKAAIRPDLNTLPSTVLGQLNGIYADKLREAWEVLDAVYQAQYPDTASGLSLDAVSAITGALRLPATQSAVNISVNLDAVTTLPAGNVVSNPATGDRFESINDITNPGGSPAEVVGAFRSEEFGPIAGVALALRKIETPLAGWNEVAATLLSGNAELYVLANGQTLLVRIDDGVAQTVTFLTADFGDITNATAAEVAAKIDSTLTNASSADDTGSVRITSDDTGFASAIEVTGGTANSILGFSTTRVVGSPFNALDATPGVDLETDSAFRTRRELLLRQTGKATLEAIRAALLVVDSVLQAFVFENTTLVTDSDGLPGKAFESVVRGGVDADIAQAIFDTKPAGILAFGVTPIVVTDSQGIDHTISFTRPTDVEIWIDIVVTVDPVLYPLDGDDQIKAILVALGDTLVIGQDVIYERFQAEVFQIPGVLDVPTFFTGLTASPTGVVNLVIASRSLAVFDTTRVTVAS